MTFNLTPIPYKKLNPRQKENYNFMKVSAILADYGFVTMRLSDDWQGADFIAQHIDGENFLKVQLKSRLTFGKKYLCKNLYITFRYDGKWYLYPHDELLEKVKTKGIIEDTVSWNKKGGYSFSGLSTDIRKLLEPYLLTFRTYV